MESELKKLIQRLFPDRPTPEVYAGQVFIRESPIFRKKSPVYWFRNWRSTLEYSPRVALERDEDI